MNKKGHKKVKRRKLRIKVVLKTLLFLAIAGALYFYISNLNTKNILITGTNNIKDVEIIEIANLQDYPKIYRLNINKIEKQIKKLPLVKNVEVTRNPLGKLTINVEENDILFFYKYNQKFISSNKKELEENDNYLGYPTLINFTPDTSFNELVKGLAKIDNNIIKMINEIEYTPYKNSEGQSIEDSSAYKNARFTLYMNDSNTVIIDTVNIKRLQNYAKIYTSLNMDTTKGVLELDTINDKTEDKEETILFRSYESIAKQEAEKAAKEEEKKEE